MGKSKRQVKRRMGTKKRRIVRRKTQKRKQTKRRRGGEFTKPEFGREKTYRSLSADAAIDEDGVLQTNTGTTLGDYSSELGSEPQRKSSLSFSNPFSRPTTPLPDPETLIVGLESMTPSEIDNMIASIKRYPETPILNNKLKQLQDKKAKIESSPSVSFETRKKPSSFGLPFFKR